MFFKNKILDMMASGHLENILFQQAQLLQNHLTSLN